MNREKADTLRNELTQVIREWAKKNNMTVTPQSGSFDSTSYTFRVTLGEMDSNGVARQDSWDREVMQNWLRDTSWAGKDPRGHVFMTTNNGKKYKCHAFRIVNFKYGTKYPWNVVDIETGESIRCNNEFIDWDCEV